MKKLILDLDTGIDDALAIAYALGSTNEVELIGITGTYGNVIVPLGVRNALAVLHLFGRDDVPVYPGVDQPLNYVSATPWSPAAGSVAVHGADGLGGAQLPDSPRSAEAPGSAVDFIIDAARTYGSDLLIVPTGAMTTMATVLHKAPDIADCGVKITMMGGALTVPGNVSPCAEANIAQDPEAADYLFRCGARTTMVGLDVTHRTVLTYAQTARWRALGTPAGDFLADMTDYYISVYLKNQPQIGGCGLHDPLAVAAAIDPTLIDTIGVNLTVDLDGAFRGRTIGDPERLRDADKTTQVAVDVDSQTFLTRFMNRVTALAER
ncbi:nucleoside hydrolase [Bifidobacterium goeldii]|uniref:Nucleoside hydrolase n=1 Tax=Bifidobacterium goeldii TaxID=2306975 RepID=A0A430FKT0_9BIFI|nr:nucleoside hydrolase [Bifidobacterium goeldii]RSX53504.1 nucleoside hydrolase [Bifidobacterium goeldii]